MSRFAVIMWSAISICIFGLSSLAQQADTTFYGQISDSQCALNVHSLTKSHQEMLKSKSGAAGTNPTTCAVYCVSYLGGKFVLVGAKGHVYHLDNQELPRKFVGDKVKVIGTLDPKTDTIHVESLTNE